MNYIWRKHAPVDWLAHHSETLERQFGSALVLIEYPEKSRVTIEIACSTGPAAQRLQEEFGGITIKLRTDWLQNVCREIRKKPLRIGSRLVVFGSPNQARSCRRQGSDRHSIIIPAGPAFGTGAHATTAMCLRLLERYTRSCRPGWKMLDAGTGSGILAIAGAHFGAGRVLAIDNDALACNTAERNARLNRCRNITFRKTNILKQKFGRKFDVITANLFSQLLVDALRSWTQHLSPEGRLIFSGILRSQECKTLRAFREHDFNVSDIRHQGRWVAAVAQRRVNR